MQSGIRVLLAERRHAGGSAQNDYRSYCPANSTAPTRAAAHYVPLTALRFACGAQREQVDKRVYYGFDASRRSDTPGTRTTIDAEVRDDNAPVSVRS